ncbi:phospholipid/cholesterol/gamma-HCH transport system substrate-binding protein [Pseudoduganella flava]|uniref:MCE family protein n=1 Tax=Pseudoduganella flava TaxID=871742 RepID=A0A562PC69_9BURK|nr:MlaD family protein [Pseudoduganella flava]QGZ40127.1 MCE family protein [Pseudoduganella flava]TWI42072.1 phospholipid/cholesterol/gamma-HCH transport system substrate-binding protein [Pseudoduganella flava]
MENRSHAFMTGIFTLSLLVAAILFGIWFNRDRVEYDPYLLATTLAVPGLNPQAAVRYRGLEVGKVDEIDFDPKMTGQILVHLSIDPETPITKTTYATLGYQGVTGIAYIQLDDDSVGSPRLATNADNPARIPLHPGLLDQLEKRGTAILSQAEKVTEKLNDLLSDENRKTILAAFSDVSDTVNRYKELPERLGPTIDRLPALATKAEGAIDSVNALAQDVTRLSQSLQGPDGTLTRLGNSVDRAVNGVEAVTTGAQLETLPSITALTDETRSSMRSVRRTMNTLNDRPQSILFGAPEPVPGPGEPGFTAPAK